MQSDKKLKNPHKYLLPYKAKFSMPIEIRVNGERFFFPADKEVELTQSQFEAIANSIYERELKN